MATYLTSTLAVGSHTIAAVYAGGAYSGNASNSVIEVITSDFASSIAPTTQWIYTGEAATYAITVTPETGFTLDVVLGCSGAPASSTCTITPSTVSGGRGTATLVLTTTAPPNMSSSLAAPSETSLAAIASGGYILVFIPRRFRRRSA